MAAAQSSTVSADSGREKPHLFSSYSVCVVQGTVSPSRFISSTSENTSAGEPSATTSPLDMSLTPVSAYKSAHSPYFTRDNVKAFNKALYKLCADGGYWYLDDYTPLADKDGYLPSSATADGVHFVTSYYPVWMDVIRTHYVART